MLFEKKLLLSIISHLMWIYLVVFCKYYYDYIGNEIGDILLHPIMYMLVYPLTTNVLVILIYKIKPLESNNEKKKFVKVTSIITIVVWIMLVLFRLLFE